MKIKKHPTQVELKALFNYDPETGILTWKVKPCKKVKIGDVAGYKKINGYLQVRINGIDYYNHRIAWIMCEGEIPDGYEIDHINQNVVNNWRTNLRLATRSQNNQNKNTHKDNKTGIKGLCEWVNKNGIRYWACEVQIKRNNTLFRKTKKLPFTESTKESQKAVATAWLERTRAELHGEFTNHGINPTPTPSIQML